MQKIAFTTTTFTLVLDRRYRISEMKFTRGLKKYFGGPTLDILALISISTSVFLFIQTQTLHARLKQYSAQEQSSGEQSQDNEIQFTLPNILYNVSALNNTVGRKEMLFFNRVPKVGSQTLMDLIIKLSKRNGFEVHRDGTQKVETIKLSYYEESRLTTLLDMFTPPSAYIKHTCFSNFSKHGYEWPIYINVVRDPIERVISWFYYIRAPWYIIERKQAFPELPLPHPAWLKKDFDSCVLEGDRECLFLPGEVHDGVGDHRRQNMFFCGHAEDCVEFNGDYALQQAKANVEKHYAVVGVLEELDLSLKVMEKFIPRFFSGAVDLFRASSTHVNRNIYKPQVSQKVKNLLRANFTKEIEFYEFCKQRLHAQYASLVQNKLI